MNPGRFSVTVGAAVDEDAALDACDGQRWGAVGVGWAQVCCFVTGAPDLRVRCDRGLLRYIVEKGSITVDGISLTIAAVHDDGFGIAVIPHTMEVTTLGHKGPGDPVNLEVDVTAKYVERLLAWKDA